jgi:2-polyprenyl-3-methyl-5-hydroxy-6-metoxy-1,4-benzoquinol methylase
MLTTEEVRGDFDEIARLVDHGASGSDQFDELLVSRIPSSAKSVLDIGCGMGRLSRLIATGDREVVGIDLSTEMIRRARSTSQLNHVRFVVADFPGYDFGREFDCIVSAAALHHMPNEVAINRMVALLRPGGRLIIHDLRRNVSLADSMRALGALVPAALGRLLRTGSPWSPRHVRQAWARHGARETYLSLQEARALAARHLPGAEILTHALWRYTIIWDKPK